VVESRFRSGATSQSAGDFALASRWIELNREMIVDVWGGRVRRDFLLLGVPYTLGGRELKQGKSPISVETARCCLKSWLPVGANRSVRKTKSADGRSWRLPSEALSWVRNWPWSQDQKPFSIASAC
jgi:hypothetical protein